MNRFRPFILAFTVALAGLLAYGLFTRPDVQGVDADCFSAARVTEDIEIISKETDIAVYILNPMTQGNNDNFKSVYEDIISDNMSIIKNALSVRRY